MKTIKKTIKVFLLILVFFVVFSNNLSIQSVDDGFALSITSTEPILSTTVPTISVSRKFVQNGDKPWAPTTLEAMLVYEKASPTAIDWDSDGDIDVLVGNSLGDITFFKNDGDNNFQRTNSFVSDLDGLRLFKGKTLILGKLIATQIAPFAVDWDSDGDMDLIVGGNSSSGKGLLRLYKNNGDDTFRKSTLSDSGDLYKKPLVYDWNSDSYLDVIVGEEDGVVKYYSNDGSGSISYSSYLIDTYDASHGLSNSAPAMINYGRGEGSDTFILGHRHVLTKYNIISYTSLEKADDIYLDDGNKFTKYYPVPTRVRWNRGSIQINQYDDIIVGGQDGSLSLLLSNSTGYYTDYFSNSDTSSSSETVEETSNTISNISVDSYSSPVMYDFDSDGDGDLIIGDKDGSIHYYENGGDNIFTKLDSASTRAIDSIVITNGYGTPAIGDFESDGTLDLVIGGFNGDLIWYQQSSGYLFTNMGNITDTSGTNIDVGRRSAPIFTDWNNDGQMDIISGGNGGKIYLYLNNGSNSFSDEGPLTDTDGNDLDVGYYSKPVAVDFDGDGNTDLLVGSDSGLIKLFINNGSGQFTSSGNIKDTDGNDITFSEYSDPYVVDLNNDGYKDLLVGAYDGKLATYMYDSSSGGYSIKIIGRTLTDRIEDVPYIKPLVADIDGDGDLDVLYGSQDGDFVLLENNSGTFEIIENFASISAATSDDKYTAPSLGDMDGDGDLDLVYGKYNGKLALYLNDGNYSFSNSHLTAYSSIDVGNYSVPTIIDWNGDGNLDIFVGESDGSINYYENDGAGGFTHTADFESIDVGDNSSPFAIDFDYDGDKDLIVGNEHGLVTLYENDGTGNLTESDTLSDNIGVGQHAAPTAGDWDNDGDMDLFVGSKKGWIYYYEYKRTLDNSGDLDTLKNLLDSKSGDSDTLFPVTQ